MNALYRSDDGGATWAKKDRSQNMIWRPFYFANLIVDPNNENRIVKPDGPLILSTDGGATFSGISGGTHGDHHDVWIDPKDSDHMITGDDGGIWYSYDGGDKWWKGENLPISQFYHVSVDMDAPVQRVRRAAGQQLLGGQSPYPGGITNSPVGEHVRRRRLLDVRGSHGPDTSSTPRRRAATSAAMNRKTHEIRDIQPLPGYKEGKLRFNWNTPIHMSPTRNGTVYIGAQYPLPLARLRADVGAHLARSHDERSGEAEAGGIGRRHGGQLVRRDAHDDLRDRRIAEGLRTVIWVGTDDGNLQLTSDGGKTWTNVVGEHHRAAEERVGLERRAGPLRRRHGLRDVRPAQFRRHAPVRVRSTDFGKTWTLAHRTPEAAPVRGYAHVIKEDLVNPRLLFLGTEFGLWISVDAGMHWSRYKGGECPSVAVRDLAIHPRDERSRDRHARARHLDHRRHHAAAAAHAADARAGRRVRRARCRWCSAPGVRRLGERRRRVRRAQSARRRDDHLLPAEAAHLRRHEARDASIRRARSWPRCPRASGGAQPRGVVDDACRRRACPPPPPAAFGTGRASCPASTR